MVGVLVAAVEDRQHAMAELDEDERTLAAEPFSADVVYPYAVDTQSHGCDAQSNLALPTVVHPAQLLGRAALNDLFRIC